MEVLSATCIWTKLSLQVRIPTEEGTTWIQLGEHSAETSSLQGQSGHIDGARMRTQQGWRSLLKALALGSHLAASKGPRFLYAPSLTFSTRRYGSGEQKKPVGSGLPDVFDDGLSWVPSSKEGVVVDL